MTYADLIVIFLTGTLLMVITGVIFPAVIDCVVLRCVDVLILLRSLF